MITKPQPDEYNPYYGTYISKVPDGDVIATLRQLKDSSFKMFSAISDDKANYAYADGKWTVKEVIGHIIDTERTFAFRLFCFSREHIELPSMDQNIYASNSNSKNRTIQSLAEEFRATRESNIYLVESLTDEQLKRTGIASGNEVSVRALVCMLAGHELHHLSVLQERYFADARAQ
ncbi:MAG: DinB family protein [Cyanobacteria bacterium SZAS-4]|nr:DinB family protein [Cyanobacteria bacterium SZAS-4]